MQDVSESMESADPGQDGQNGTADAPGVDDPTRSSSSDSTTASTVLVEVLPGVAVVFGEVPVELSLELIDFGLVSVEDRTLLATVLASAGNTATVGGNVGTAVAGAQGLYRLSGATQAVLKAGGSLAVKDGANLGAVIVNGKIVSQARWIPAAAVSVPSAMAVLGPALAMVAIQMSLNEIAGLARTNIALTSQVLTTIRHEQWAELEGLMDAVDDVLAKARSVSCIAGMSAGTYGRLIGSTRTPGGSISRPMQKRSSSTPMRFCHRSRPGSDIRPSMLREPGPLGLMTPTRRGWSTSSPATLGKSLIRLGPRW